MPSLRNAINRAIQYTWDESHGYEWGGMGSPDFDCSGFVGRCLYEAGFNYPSGHVGTWDMTSLGDNRLQLAGFIELRYTTHDPVILSKGDIVVLNHTPLGAGGHTFFYMENIRAYTDPSARSNNIDIVQKVKVEASSTRTSGYQYPDPGTQPGDVNNPATPGDYPRNGTGAYWEVWTHAYNEPFYYGYDPAPNSSDYIHVYKWPGGYDDDYLTGLLFFGLDAYRKRRRHNR